MTAAGFDLAGVNSTVCLMDEVGGEMIQGSKCSGRPSVVLLPMVRRETVLAGDDAISSERGIGMSWPPLSQTDVSGWSHMRFPPAQGRLLLASVWEQLTRSTQWPSGQWDPPDGLPRMSIPSPAECVAAEFREVATRISGVGAIPLRVLAVPNSLSEEAQDALLRSLPNGVRLIWRSVAVAMAWAAANSKDHRNVGQLAVVDVTPFGTEVSIFDFRTEVSGTDSFLVPVRRPKNLRYVTTGNILQDSPSPFLGLRIEPHQFQRRCIDVAAEIGSVRNVLFCGPLAAEWKALLEGRFPGADWAGGSTNEVCRGAALFGWRLLRDLPTYVDVLPSLELYTLTETHEPKWLSLIPSDHEISGGQDYQATLERPIFIEKGTAKLGSWLQRSGENQFRKLTTELPIQAAENAAVDLRITARPAGGFARIEMVPSHEAAQVFGAGQSLQLNWQSMERVERPKDTKWPVKISYGWPACGSLYAYRPFVSEFLDTARRFLPRLDDLSTERRIETLGRLKDSVKKTIPPQMAGLDTGGDDAAPINQLVCFGSNTPCEILEASPSGLPRISNLSTDANARVAAIGEALLTRLMMFESMRTSSRKVRNALVYVLGRMGGAAPAAFREYVAERLTATSSSVLLFAAGRVLVSPSHGELVFSAIADRARADVPLNNLWLRMLVYVLYQRPDLMSRVPRDDLFAAARLCVEALTKQIELGNYRILFTNSLRSIALLLRARRYEGRRDFLTLDNGIRREQRLVRVVNETLDGLSRLRLRPGPKILVKRVGEWMDYSAATDEMPPIAAADEDEETEDSDDD